MERSVHDEFVARMVEEVKKIKIGDPLDRSTAHGPQNHKYAQQPSVIYIYSGTPLIRTPEMWPPLYSGHIEKSQSMRFTPEMWSPL